MTSEASSFRWWPKLLLIGLIIAGASAPFWWPSPDVVEQEPDLPPIPDPRDTFDSALLNIRPSVQYVGDQACAECHAEIVQKFAKHPMGQSAFTVSDFIDQEQINAEAHAGFSQFSIHYEVERQGDQLIHSETILARDEPFAQLSEPVDYIIGSGRHGRAYLVERDGRLFQSPISWYTGQTRWDVSAGYSRDRHFNRAITQKCLFCHVNRVEPIDEALNRYEQPIFRGLSIGCERCHGPGELHVQKHQDQDRLPEGFDPTIANPTHMDQHLRIAVCEQCHLQGEQRIVRLGRDTFDYRPGMPLHPFWSVFTRRPEFLDQQQAVTQIEQMEISQCFQKSGTRMDCTSCHNPHEVPTPDERVDYFRGRCLNCHREHGCALPEPERIAQQADNDCTACHMPKGDVTNISHTSLTDHRILRIPEAQESPPRIVMQPGEIPLVHYHRDRPGVEESLISRDLGIALTRLAEEQSHQAFPIVQVALPLLDEAIQNRRDDVAAWESKGICLSALAKYEEALAAYEKTLELAPNNEMALSGAAAVARWAGRPEVAVNYARQAIEQNPWIPRYHFTLADALAAQDDWTGALDACREALRLNPTYREARELLIVALIKLDQDAEAQTEFDRLLALEPRDRIELRRWYAEQRR